jgi:cysteine desulfurase
MLEALDGLVPNPSGPHRLARRTRSVLEDAREAVAGALGVSVRSVVFTSGGTESCNLAMRTASEVVWVSSIEHAAVREAAGRHGELGVTGAGVLEVEAAAAQIGDSDLVSVMAANNETGAIQPLSSLVDALGGRRERVTIHSDAVGAAWCMDLKTVAAQCDLVSIAAHKLGGPAGSGALIVSGNPTIAPMLLGGGQERGLRSGTQDVAAAVGLAAALEFASADRRSGAVAAMGRRRDRLEETLRRVAGVEVTSADAPRLESHLHVTISGVRAEELLVLLDAEGICAAAGAACASGAPRPSRVLEAMGIDQTRARGALRLTLSPTTTDAEIDRAALVIVEAIGRLRR